MSAPQSCCGTDLVALPLPTKCAGWGERLACTTPTTAAPALGQQGYLGDVVDLPLANPLTNSAVAGRLMRAPGSPRRRRGG